MADFNKEYQKRYSPGMGWDFSIKAIFAKLKDSEVYPIICEGYGFETIANESGKCILIYRNGTKVEFSELDTYLRENGLLPENND